MDFKDGEPLPLTVWAIQIPGSTGFCNFIAYATGLQHLLREFINFFKSIIFFLMGENTSTCIISQNVILLSEKCH